MSRKPFQIRGFAAGLAFTLALAAVGNLVLAAPLWAAGGYLVSDERKECYAVEQAPGIGLGGLRYSETCPEGYEVKPLPQPEPPWYVKLLDALDKWFGLKSKVLWIPTAGQVALVSSLVLVLRRLLQLFQVPLIEKLTHGWGTVALSALISFLTVVQPMLEDQTFTAYELGLALAATLGMASAFWETLKTLVGSSVGSERISSWFKKLFGLMG